MYTKKKGPNVWVVPRGGAFSIREEGIRAYLVPPITQQRAIGIARQLASANGSELVVLSRSGRIRERDSHGADRFPPKG